MTGRWGWRKRVPPAAEEEWWTRLEAVHDRLAVVSLAGARTIRLEAFQLTRREAEVLKLAHGGQTLLRTDSRLPAAPLRKPLRIRGRLIIVGSEHEAAAIEAGKKDAEILRIPAGMAFGTGDHATTATCLRLLADVSVELRGHAWEMLDLGTGSGILALAARVFGARRAVAADFDAAAVRTARENARANGIAGVTVRRLDVRSWQPPRTWRVVVANLFSGVLIEAAGAISAAVQDGGSLIFSGVLREQEVAVVAALQRTGFRLERVVRRGKWIAGLARRSDHKTL